MTPGLEPRTEVVRRIGRVLLGSFSTAPGDPDFHGGVTTRTLAVFPRTAVAICPRHQDEVVADTATVMLYNSGDEYARRAIDPVGDRCHWWSIPDEWWVQLAEEADRDGRLTHHRPGAGRVFSRAHCPSPGKAWLLQRTLARRAAEGRLEPLVVEEELLAVLRLVLGADPSLAVAAGARWAPTPGTVRRHRKLVADTKELLAGTLGDALCLDRVAAVVGCSPYHLSRIFRVHTGRTIHQYRTELRLRASLDRFGERDLAGVASDLGFANHSHYTAAFRRAFGIAPSQVRKIMTA